SLATRSVQASGRFPKRDSSIVLRASLDTRRLEWSPRSHSRSTSRSLAPYT
ncbi:hypothetical protein COCMIDRAFT_109716, partial [Bipolaris oryzae ATCC 44560]